MTVLIASDIISKTENYVQSYMSRYDASHDYSHIQRVLHNAKFIVKKETYVSCNMNVVTLAALLHDIGDSKYTNLDEDGSILAKDFLLSIKVPL